MNDERVQSAIGAKRRKIIYLAAATRGTIKFFTRFPRLLCGYTKLI
jgi:hypothetical protein